jgi:hypothetical protein
MKSFLHGKKSHPTPALRVSAATVGAVHRAAGSTHAELSEAPPAPTVETVKEGDKVVRLVVTCSCGEKIEIDCIYPAGS